MLPQAEHDAQSVLYCLLDGAKTRLPGPAVEA
jgi:hypothetical protein